MKATLVLLALHISLVAIAQERCDAVFFGQILDGNNQPVAGAGISLLSKDIGQASDRFGGFRFESLCDGRYKVKIQHLGYEDVEIDLAIKGEVRRIIRLKELATALDEVVIEHHDETRTEHATNFTGLDERQLAENAGKSIGESLLQLPGVSSIQTGPGIFKPVIHGVHSQRILVLNHGLKQEGQQWGAEHAPEIDPFIASNIIVIKDASAIKYGTDALGGVIVVNPPALPDEDGLAGTFNTVLQSNGRSGTVSGMLEGGIRRFKGWGWRVQGTLKKGGDFHTPDYVLTNTGVRESNFSVATGYHNERAGFDVFFSHFQTEIGILKGTSIETKEDLFAAMKRSEPAYTGSFSYGLNAPRQQVSHNLLKLHGHMQTRGGEWRWQYGFQNNNRKEFDLRIGHLSEVPATDLRLNTHSLDVEWETRHAGNRTIAFGMNGTYQKNLNIYGTRRIPFIPNFTSISSGLFGVAKFHFNTWTVDVGARYDYRHFDVTGFDFKNALYSTSSDFNNISMTAGATKQLGQQQTLNLNLSTSWRPPHVAELYSLGKHQRVGAIEYGLMLDPMTNEVMDINEVKFKSEQALKFVTAYRIKGEKLSLDVGPFANYIFNYIYLRAAGVTQMVSGVYPYFRYDQTDALFLGADFTATWHMHPHLTLIPQASLLQATDEGNDDYFAFIPSNRYEVRLRYARPHLLKFSNFYLESQVKYVARQRRAPRTITEAEIDEAFEGSGDPFGKDDRNFDFMAPPPAYWLLHLSAGVSIKAESGQYDFSISSDNTLNEAYREYTNRFRYYADDRGRNITLSFKYIF